MREISKCNDCGYLFEEADTSYYDDCPVCPNCNSYDHIEIGVYDWEYNAVSKRDATESKIRGLSELSSHISSSLQRVKELESVIEYYNTNGRLPKKEYTNNLQQIRTTSITDEKAIERYRDEVNQIKKEYE